MLEMWVRHKTYYFRLRVIFKKHALLHDMCTGKEDIKFKNYVNSGNYLNI